MKNKIIISTILSMLIFGQNLSFAQNEISGRWAEKISERVVMDIYPENKNADEYQIFITWREDNLAQKDIYRFKAKSNNNILKYENGTHIYRFYNSKKQFEDKLDYSDGSGEIRISNGELIWLDYKNKDDFSIFKPADKNLTKDTTVKNKLFSITLPEELRGFYETKIEKNKISVYDKKSKKAGFGGFAFGIKAYKNPSDHAVLPGSRKLGELTDKRGNLYDIVLKHPTDVQYDYTQGPNPPESFKLLYEVGDAINIQGIKGATYFKNQGTKGEALYKDILKKHITAINEKWDSTKLEKENMSYMYNVMSVDNKQNLLDRIGYTYYDINDDGIEELLIGEIADGNWKGVIYDMYTMVDRMPKHVISGGSRDRYYACDDVFVCREYSSGANESGTIVYILVENSTELFPQVSFKYDGYKNPKKPWFLSYGASINDDEYENVTEETYEERKSTFDKYERFNFTPLSKVKFK